MNAFRTAMLLAAMTALFMALGDTMGGATGAAFALALAAGLNLLTFWNADKVVLKMHGARAVDARAAPRFVGLVHELAGRAGLPVPRTFLAPFAAMIVQLAISRTREYSADRAAEISGRPCGGAIGANPAAAHLHIVPARRRNLRDDLFSSHPDTASRIAALEEIARTQGEPPPPRRATRGGTVPPVARRRASALDPLGRRG